MPRKPPKERVFPPPKPAPRPPKKPKALVKRTANVKFQSPPIKQRSPLLLLAAEIRSRIWELLFEDSEVCYDACQYSRSSSVERNQIAQTCRFAYLDTFTILWSHTTMVFIDCVPSPDLSRSETQFAASVPCIQLITKVTINIAIRGDHSYIPFYRDLGGLKHYYDLQTLEIGSIPIPHWHHLRLRWATVRAAENSALILAAIKKHLHLVLDRNIVRLIRCQSRTYNVILKFILITSGLFNPTSQLWVVCHPLSHGT